MSLQAARDFIDKAMKDPSIQKELAERTKDPVDIGRENGFDFTKDEFDQAMRERDTAVTSTQGTGWSTFS